MIPVKPDPIRPIPSIPRKSGGDLCGPERSNRTEKWMENWELIEVSPLGCDFGSMKHRPIST